MKSKRFARVLCLVLAVMLVGGLTVPLAQAKDLPEDTSFYHMSSIMAVYVNKKLSENSSSTSGVKIFSPLKSDGSGGVAGVGNAGGFLGYADPSDAGEGFFGQLMSQLSGSSSTFSYASVQGRKTDSSAYTNSLYYYCQYGYLLSQIGFDSTGTNLSLGGILRFPAGGIMIGFYLLLSLVELIFSLAVFVLKIINPFAWAGAGIDAFFQDAETAGGLGTFAVEGTGPMQSVHAIVSRMYTVMTEFGWAVAIPLFLVMMVFSIFAVQNGRSAGHAVKKFVMRVFTIALCVPLCGMCYTVALNSLSDEFMGGGSTSAYIVGSTFVDFESWAKNYRLKVPNSVAVDSQTNVDDENKVCFALDTAGRVSGGASATTSASNIEVGGAPSGVTKANVQRLALAVNDMAIFSGAFEKNGLLGLSSSDSFGGTSSSSDSISGSVNWNVSAAGGSDTATQVDGDGTIFMATMSMLGRYMAGDFFFASDWESLAKNRMTTSAGSDSSKFDTMATMYEATNKVKEIKEDFLTSSDWLNGPFDVWNNGGMIASPGSTRTLSLPVWGGSSPTLTLGGTLDSASSVVGTVAFGNMSGTGSESESDASPGTDPSYKGGLSTMSMYNYLTTKFSSSGAIVYSSKLASSGFVREAHYSVNLIGTGIESMSYWLNAVVLMGCLVVLGFSYAMGIMFGGMRRTFDILSAMPMALLGTFNGLMKILTYTVMLLCEILVTLFMYRLFVDVFMFMSQTVVSKTGELFETLTVTFGGQPVSLGILGTMGSGWGTFVLHIFAIGLEIFTTKTAIKYRSVIVRQMEELASRVTQDAVQRLTGTQMPSMLPSMDAENASLASPTRLMGEAAAGLKHAADAADAHLDSELENGMDSDAQQEGDENDVSSIAAGAAALEEGAEAGAELDNEAAAIDRAMDDMGRGLNSLEDAVDANTAAAPYVSDDDVINQMDADGDGDVDTGDEMARMAAEADAGHGPASLGDAGARMSSGASKAASAMEKDEAGDKLGAAADRVAAAEDFAAAGDMDRAADMLREAADAYAENGDHDKAAEAYRKAAEMADKAGDAEAARADSLSAAEENKAAGRHGEAAEDYANAGKYEENAAKKADAEADAFRKAAAMSKDPNEKAAYLNAAHEAESRADAHRLSAADNQEMAAAEAARDGDSAKAAGFYDDAAKNAMDSGNPALAAQLSMAAAEQHAAAGDADAAAKSAKDAAGAFEAAGDAKGAEGARSAAESYGKDAEAAKGEAAEASDKARELREKAGEIEDKSSGEYKGLMAQAGDESAKAAAAFARAGDAKSAAASLDEAAAAKAKAGDAKSAAALSAEAAEKHMSQGEFDAAAQSAASSASQSLEAAKGATSRSERGMLESQAADQFAKESDALKSAGHDTEAAQAEIQAGQAAASAAGNFRAAGQDARAAEMDGKAANYSASGAAGMMQQAQRAEAGGDTVLAGKMAGDAEGAAEQAAESFASVGDMNRSAAASMMAADAGKKSAGASSRRASALSKEADAHDARAAELDKTAAQFDAAARMAQQGLETRPNNQQLRKDYESAVQGAKEARAEAAQERKDGASKRSESDKFQQAAMSHAARVGQNAEKAGMAYGTGSDRSVKAMESSVQAMRASAAGYGNMAASARAQAGSFQAKAESLRAQAENASGEKKEKLIGQAKAAEGRANGLNEQADKMERSAIKAREEATQQAMVHATAMGGNAGGVYAGKAFKSAAGSAEGLCAAAIESGSKLSRQSAAAACNNAATLAGQSARSYIQGGNAGGAAAMFGQQAAMYQKAASMATSKSAREQYTKAADAALKNKVAAEQKAETAAMDASKAYSEVQNNRGNPLACGMAAERSAAAYQASGDLKRSALMHQQASASYMQVADSSQSQADFAKASTLAAAAASQFAAIGDSRKAALMYDRAATMAVKAGNTDSADALRDKAQAAMSTRPMTGSQMTRMGETVSRMTSLGGPEPRRGSVSQPMGGGFAAPAGGSAVQQPAAPAQGGGGYAAPPTYSSMGAAAMGGVIQGAMASAGIARSAPQSQQQQPAQAQQGGGRSGPAPLPANATKARSAAYRDAVNVRDANAAVQSGMGRASTSAGGGKQSVMIQTSSGAARVATDNAADVQRAMAGLPAELRPKMGDVMQAQAAYQQASGPAERSRQAKAYQEGLVSVGYSEKCAGLMRQQLETQTALNTATSPSRRAKLEEKLNQLNGQVEERMKYEASPRYAEYKRREAHEKAQQPQRNRVMAMRVASALLMKSTQKAQAHRRFGMGQVNDITMAGIQQRMYQQGVGAAPMYPGMYGQMYQGGSHMRDPGYDPNFPRSMQRDTAPRPPQGPSQQPPPPMDGGKPWM